MLVVNWHISHLSIYRTFALQIGLLLFIIILIIIIIMLLYYIIINFMKNIL